MLFIFCGAQRTRVGSDDARVRRRLVNAIDNYIVEHSSFLVFILHINIIAWNLTIDGAFRNVQRELRLPCREKQRVHFHLSFGQNIVLEEKSANGDQDNEDNQRFHHPYQRNACRLERSEFYVLTKITKSHQRGKQYSQRQRHRNKRQRRIEKQFCQHMDFQPTSHQVVDITEKELH